MAWDFSTETEFQHQLDWIRDFVDNEIIPIELIQGGAQSGATRPTLGSSQRQS